MSISTQERQPQPTPEQQGATRFPVVLEDVVGMRDAFTIDVTSHDIAGLSPDAAAAMRSLFAEQFIEDQLLAGANYDDKSPAEQLAIQKAIQFGADMIALDDTEFDTKIRDTYGEDAVDDYALAQAIVAIKAQNPIPVPGSAPAAPPVLTPPAPRAPTPVPVVTPRPAPAASVPVPAPQSPVNPGNLPPLADRMTAASAELTKRQNELAAFNAKRQARVHTTYKNGDKYAQTELAYNDQLAELGKLSLEKFIIDNPAATPIEVRTHLVKHVMDQEIALRTSAVEKMQNTKFSKVINWMTRGSKKAKFGKTMLVSGAAAIIIGAATLATGGAAVAIGAGIGAKFGLGTMKFFARKDAKQGRGYQTTATDATLLHQKLDDSQPVLAPFDVDAALAALITQTSRSVEKDTKYEQTKRRKAVAWAIGGTAVGAVTGHYAGGLLHDAYDHIKGSSAISPTRHASSVGDAIPHPDPEAKVPVLDPPQLPVAQSPVPPSNFVVQETFSDAGSNISVGEGLYQSIGEITNNPNISSEQLYSIMQEVGPKLQEQGLAYPMGSDSWGLSHTGAMPYESMKLIADVARAHGVVKY